MNITYAITVCNEHKELERLLDQLYASLKEEDEILIQADEQNCTKEVIKIMNKWSDKDSKIKQLFFPLNKNFAHFKNNIFNYAKSDYICYIDADETLANSLLENLKTILEMNQVDLIMVPRANTVEGLTDSHIKTWGWRVENGLVNWPDYQARLVKNNNNMRWQGKVHEKIVGFTTISHLPHDNQDWCFMHPKTIERQEKQNSFYNTI